jgi:hypothetical protein
MSLYSPTCLVDMHVRGLSDTAESVSAVSLRQPKFSSKRSLHEIFFLLPVSFLKTILHKNKYRYIGKHYTHIVTGKRWLKGVFMSNKESAFAVSLKPWEPIFTTGFRGLIETVESLF